MNDNFHTILKARLIEVYSDKITIRCGHSHFPNYAINDKKNTVDIAIYIHLDTQIAVIWDVKSRRQNNTDSHCLNLCYEFEFLKEKNTYGLSVYYKKMHTCNNVFKNEKVIVMNCEMLKNNIYLLYELLTIDKDDDTYPKDNNDINNEEINNKNDRCRITTSKLLREQKFRFNVLNRYGNQCAICRCDELTVLEAAHIKAVAAGGSDNVENGICLCANHHRMYDNQLFDFDLKNHCLKNIEERVKLTIWFEYFEKMYKGSIVHPVLI